jgi:hypothetical protein
MKLHFVSILASVLSNSNLWLHAELGSLDILFQRHGLLPYFVHRNNLVLTEITDNDWIGRLKKNRSNIQFHYKYI